VLFGVVGVYYHCYMVLGFSFLKFFCMFCFRFVHHEVDFVHHEIDFVHHEVDFFPSFCVVLILI